MITLKKMMVLFYLQIWARLHGNEAKLLHRPDVQQLLPWSDVDGSVGPQQACNRLCTEHSLCQFGPG